MAAMQQPPPDLWPIWAAIKGPILILRGEHSDLLSPATVDKMLRTNPGARLHTVVHTGHAPMLMDEATIHTVAAFLRH